MWPWGHLAVGYFLYVGWCRARDRPIEPTPLALLALGTQFPDLIDKPLAWTFGVLPGGRTLAHTLLVAVPLVLLLWALRRTSATEAFGLGYLSHPAADAVRAIVESRFGALAFLLWPALPLPAWETEPSFLGHVLGLELDLFVMVQFALFGLAIGHWRAIGAPGLARSRHAIRRWLARSTSK